MDQDTGGWAKGREAKENKAKTPKHRTKMKALRAYKAPKGIVKVYPDETPANPWKDWDGNVPLIVEGGRNFGSHDYGDVESAIWSALGKLDTADLERIAALLDDGAALIAEAKEYDEDLGDAIHNHVNNMTGGDRLDQLAAICSGLGWPALSTGSSGYSQGDYVDLLAVWTPEFGRTHRPDATPEDVEQELRSAVKLFGQWAWGDVYGFIAEDADGEEDSCWGFYGDDDTASGLLEEAWGIIGCAPEDAEEVTEEDADEYLQGLRSEKLADLVPAENLEAVRKMMR